MKFAVAELPGQTAPVLVEVDNDKVRTVEGATADDLLAAAIDPSRFSARTAISASVADVRFLPPVARPPSIRDFTAFEAHTINTLAGLGQKPDPAWYDAPLFYFSNPAAVIGDGDVVRRPRGSRKLDYEVEVAVVIGREASNLDADDPNVLDCVAGFTFLNDWSARDLAGKEMKHYLGPAKGKDFATAIGPWLVTPDEFELIDGVFDERVTARVNGETYTDNTTAGMTFHWGRILAHASANTTLQPGDVIGSGTVGFGCILELRTKDKAINFLADGDVVELESPKLGILRNIVGPTDS